ncbi:DMT family transporter [Fictibacillus iocasae]|uniref:DMT family transporter n=1 Tax=Fictibacillus iocasae TaxID=2715437 RepID=A0ABW2NTF6_9BACL
MKGILFAIIGGLFITLQGVANAQIGTEIGTWQAATVTQFTGFVAALFLMMLFRDKTWRHYRKVKPLYLTAGSFAAIIIFSNITAIHEIGVTLTIASVLIAQLAIAFFTDIFGWFSVAKQRMQLPQFVGIAMMVAGVLILSF